MTCGDGQSQRIEHTIGDVFQELSMFPSLDAKNLLGNTCSDVKNMYQDFVFAGKSIVSVEIDEEKGHSTRNVLCEAARLVDSGFAIKDGRPFITVRVNPDKDVNDDGATLDERLVMLVAIVKVLLECQDDDKFLNLEISQNRPCAIYIGYGKAGERHIDKARELVPVLDIRDLDIVLKEERISAVLDAEKSIIQNAVKERQRRFLQRVQQVTESGEQKCIAEHHGTLGTCTRMYHKNCSRKRCGQHCTRDCDVHNCSRYAEQAALGKGRCIQCKQQALVRCTNGRCSVHCKKNCACK
jgi:hypothetical protein